MKPNIKLKPLFFGLAFSLSSFCATAYAELIEPPPGLIVHFDKTASKQVNAFLSADSGALHDGQWLDGQTLVVDVDTATDQAAINSFQSSPSQTADWEARWQRLRAKMAELSALPGVRLVEPDYLGRFDTAPSVPWPNDPGLDNQWWLQQVNAPYLWSLYPQRTITVAVIDSGVDTTHPDLTAVIDPHSYSFGDDNPNVYDQIGHGTGIAGIIAAQRDNALGVAGLGVGVNVLPLKINSGAENDFRTSTAIKAINYAVENGAKVINLSLSADKDTEALANAIDQALAQNVVIVASAGNSGADVLFPANHPGVIAVAASNQLGELTSFSCRGPAAAIAAPGLMMYSTAIGGGYDYYTNGTSFSAPVVTATVASLLAVNPGFPTDWVKPMLQVSKAPLTGADPYGIGNLDLGLFSFWALPELVLISDTFYDDQSIEMFLYLPPTLRPVSVSVSVAADWGEFYLTESSWVAVSPGEQGPALFSNHVDSSYYFQALFGQPGIFAPLPLAGFPPGNYQWKVTMTDEETKQVVGTVSSTSMTLLP